MTLSRITLLFISAFGLMAGANLSFTHLQLGEVCPMIGPVPACFIVLLGYLGIFLAASFIQKPRASKLFYMGWLPVCLLAAIGVILELIKGQTCPPGALGIPQCFFSLAMAVTCWVLYRRAA